MSVMKTFDFWDIDDIMSEELEVTCKSNQDILGGGLLASSSDGKLTKDLKAGAKVEVPFWFAQGFVRRNNFELELPSIFGASAQEDLQRDPAVCRLNDKSSYYFEIGIRVATLLKKNELVEDLFRGFNARWKEIVKLFQSMGGHRGRYSHLNAGASLFPLTFTSRENDIHTGGEEAEAQFKRWVERFAVSEMRPSLIAEQPLKKFKS